MTKSQNEIELERDLSQAYRLIAVLVEKLGGYAEITVAELENATACLATPDRDRKLTVLERQRKG